MCFFPSLIGKDPIHVKSVLKEEENIEWGLAELHNHTNEECGYDFKYFFLLMVCRISWQTKE